MNTPSRLRSFSVPTSADSSHTIGEAICAALAEPTHAGASFQTSDSGSIALGARALADEMAREAISIWCSHSEEMESLVRSFVTITTKEPLKRRAHESVFEASPMIAVERCHQFELQQMLVDADWAQERKQNAIRLEAERFCEGQHTAMRHCILSLKGKQRQFVLALTRTYLTDPV
jgi:hypothetical protein